MAASDPTTGNPKADDLMRKAEAAKTRWTLFSGNAKYEEAAGLYEQAANHYRTSKQVAATAKALTLAAEMNIKCGDMTQAVNNYVKAANAYRKDDPHEAVRCLRVAISFSTDSGRFSAAARYQQDVGEILEAQLELEGAIQAYELAAEYFEGDNNSSQSAKCLLKVAHFCAQLEQYDRAIEVFEIVGRLYLANSLLKWSARALLLKAGLCHLANGDLISAQRGIGRYKEMDPTFAAQRECKFLEQIVKSFAENQVKDFSTACGAFDQVTPFDAWFTTILLRIKNKMFVGPGGPGMGAVDMPGGGGPPVLPVIPDDLS